MAPKLILKLLFLFVTGKWAWSRTFLLYTHPMGVPIPDPKGQMQAASAHVAVSVYKKDCIHHLHWEEVPDPTSLPTLLQLHIPQLNLELINGARRGSRIPCLYIFSSSFAVSSYGTVGSCKSRVRPKMSWTPGPWKKISDTGREIQG